jgi:hypothetical protein
MTVAGPRVHQLEAKPSRARLRRLSLTYRKQNAGLTEMQRMLRRVSVGCRIVLGSQLVLLLIASTIQYDRFGLDSDFSLFNQAAYLISHGDLLPTTLGTPYLDDHFGLLIYPITLLYLVYPHGVLLLWLQDIAGVAAEVAVLRWVYFILSRRLGDAGESRDRLAAAGVLCGVTLLMLLNPWFYTACLFEFHLLAFAALFLVCVLSNAWRGKLGWAWFWAGALLLTGDTGGLYLAGAGVSIAIASPTFRRRIAGVAAMCVGFIWLFFVTAVAVKANTVVQNYTWLVTGGQGIRENITLWKVLKAIVLHPHRQLQMIWGKRVYVYKVLIPTGVIGLFSPWMWGTDVITFYAMTLAFSLTFLVDGFNLLAGFFVGAAGTAMVLSFLISKQRAWINAGVALLLVIMLGQSIALAVTELPGIPSYWYRVSPTQAVVLGEVLNETPEISEVIASGGVMGRFSGRDAIYGFDHSQTTFKVLRPVVIFVFAPHAGIETLKASEIEDAIGYTGITLHAEALVNRDGIYAFLWHPAPNVYSVNLLSLSLTIRR